MIVLMQNHSNSEEGVDFSRRVSREDLTNWTSDNFDFYSDVATIATSDLEESFQIHNKSRAFGLEDERIQTIKRHYTMSVGDILRDSNGDHHMVCGMGFKKIEGA